MRQRSAWTKKNQAITATETPLTWWSQRCYKYHAALSQVEGSIFALLQPQCQQGMFSAAGDIVTAQRSQLKSLSMLTFLAGFKIQRLKGNTAGWGNGFRFLRDISVLNWNTNCQTAEWSLITATGTNPDTMFRYIAQNFRSWQWFESCLSVCMWLWFE